MKKLLISNILIYVILINFIGCSWTTEPNEPDKIYVSGEVLNTGEASILVSFAPVVPLVTVNQETLAFNCFLYHPYIQGLWYSGVISESAGDSVHLKVNYTRGIATASSRIPENFEIISHDTSQITYIAMDSSLSVSWSAANYAAYYRILFELSFSYEDTLGNYLQVITRKDTSITSTSIIFSMSQLFPVDVDSITVSWGSFEVRAMNGPRLEPGFEGNVEGDGSGFFWCRTYGGHLEFRIEGTKKAARKRLSEKELSMKWFERARMMDQEY